MANNIAPTNYQIIARVNYNLENNTTSCPANFPTICSPAPPAGWQSTAPFPPLGGHFVWVTTQVGGDGYLYMFGTGKYRASYVYLARMPLTNLESIGHCSSPPCYLGQTPGFQIWTTSAPDGSQQAPAWSSSPPSTAEINDAAPLSFSDDTTADYGQISVRFFDTLGVSGLWLMMSTPDGNPAFAQKVTARWALSPTGPWSNALVVFDVSNATGSQNQKLYCCQGQWNSKLDPSGLKVWECLGPGDGAQAQQIMECKDASMMQTSGSAGPPRYGFYSPFMLPYLTNVSSSTSTQSGIRYVTDTFTVSYLLSVFEPYNSVLMEYTLQVVAPVNVPVISVSPGFDNYGNLKVKRSSSTSFVVKNSGKANLSITSAITGPDASMFKITSGSGSKTIKPGKSLTIKVVFKPTSTGSKSADLEITSNDPATPSVGIALTGTGQ